TMIENKVELVAELVLESIGKTEVVSRHTEGTKSCQVSFRIKDSPSEKGSTSFLSELVVIDVP
ncbi:hypothetical protein NE574_14800, partial [Eggerthella lenta]|nr:hypothetical protein [Eggerthella lenta]